MFRRDTGIGPSSGAAPLTGEQARSALLAHRAIALIKALKLPATPRVYELCYAYATGEYPSLNTVINDLLHRRIAIGDATIKQIGAKYMPHRQDRERIDQVGMRVKQVIGEVLTALGTIINAEGDFSSDLGEAEARLAAAKSRQALIDEIRSMMESAKRLGDEQRWLEQSLNTSVDEISELRDQLQKIRAGNVTDPITGLPNRMSFERSLEKAMTEWEDHSTSGCLVLCDLDDFKKFNDAWGHLTGDQVLCLVATELRQKVVKTGVVARLGGAQFAITLPGAQIEVARAVADQIRCAVMSRDITMRSTNQRLGRISLSFGIATAHTNETPAMLLMRAQTCLRQSKDRGRNRVVCEGDPGPAPELQVAFG
jgi:diguanylate cyclase